MARDLALAAAQAPHFRNHQNPFRFQLNTAASVVIVFCGIGASISIMGVVALYCWCCKNNRRDPNQAPQHQDNLIFSVAEEENRAAREKLSRRVVEKLPIASYESIVAGSEENASECCSVCLAEFDNGEIHAPLSDKLQIRMLPDCGHFFHTECIQLWLCSYFSCPLCRRNITIVPPVAPAAPVGENDHQGSVDGQREADGSAPVVILTVAQNHNPQSVAAGDSGIAESNGSTARDSISATVAVIVGSSEDLSNNSATK